MFFPRCSHCLFNPACGDKISFYFFKYFSKHSIYLPNLSNYYIGYRLVTTLPPFVYKNFRVIIFYTVMPCRYCPRVIHWPYLKIVLSEEISIVF